jgi:hypothetical protein
MVFFGAVRLGCGAIVARFIELRHFLARFVRDSLPVSGYQ